LVKAYTEILDVKYTPLALIAQKNNASLLPTVKVEILMRKD
jgi:hypothetical protein